MRPAVLSAGTCENLRKKIVDVTNGILMDSSKDIFSKAFTYSAANEVKKSGLYPFFRVIQSTSGSSVVSGGSHRVMIGSNNYLGFTHHPRVIEAARDAIVRFGSGCTGSRFLNGNLELHEQLEAEFVRFLGKPAALVLTTGFLTNLSVISAISGRKDVIYSDRENHASIMCAQQMAICETIKFKHNDPADLERVLEMTRSKYEGAMIVADGVFSMSGDIFRLDQVARIAKKYGCRVYVDDAHGMGVMGPQGQGTAHHFGIQDDVDLIMGTFSKSFASLGGVVAGDETVIDFIRHNARPFIFSASIPPSAAATVLECLRILREEPQHLENLRRNALKMSEGFRSIGFNTLGSQTPIIPILIGDDLDAFKFAAALYENGVFATPVVSPAVPKGCALIRTSYMASHRDEDLNYVLEVFEKLGQQFGITGNAGRQAELNELASHHFGIQTV